MQLIPRRSLDEIVSGHLTRLCAGADRAVLALSGGGDSIALAHIAAPWADRAGVRLRAVIIDHGLGPHSADHAEFAASAARALGLEVKIIVWRGEKPDTGIQAAARQARHALIAAETRAFGARHILTGHTLDDQAETLWMRAARGGHWRALSAMAEAGPHPLWPQGRALEIVRPLLTLRRARLREFLQDAGAAWIEDPANEDFAYERIRIRRRLDALEGAGLPPQRLAGIAAQARRLAEQEDARAAEILRNAAFFPEGRAALPVSGMRGTDTAVAGRILQALIAAVSGAPHLPPRHRGDALVRALISGEADAATLGGALVWLADGKLQLARDPGSLLGRAGQAPAAPAALTPGREMVWDGRYRIETQHAGLWVSALAARAGDLPAPARNRLTGLHPKIRATLPVLMQGDEIAAAPLLGYHGEIARLTYMGEARLAHLRLGAKTAGAGGERRSGAPHSDSDFAAPPLLQTLR